MGTRQAGLQDILRLDILVDQKVRPILGDFGLFSPDPVHLVTEIIAQQFADESGF
jgi:hypothetical protein